jgi:hypothetical protein
VFDLYEPGYFDPSTQFFAEPGEELLIDGHFAEYFGFEYVVIGPGLYPIIQNAYGDIELTVNVIEYSEL